MNFDEAQQYNQEQQRPANTNFNNMVKHRQDNPRVTQNIKQKISNKQKNQKQFNFVQGNKSMINNTSKLSPQNQLNLESVYKKHAERLHYNMMENQRSPRGSVGDTDRRPVIANTQRSNSNEQQSQGSQPRQVVTMFHNSDAANPDNRGGDGAPVYYGDLNVDENGQLVDDYQLQGPSPGQGVAILNFADAMNEGREDHPKSKNTRRKKLRSMENKPKTNNKQNRSVKSQIREVQELNNAYYRPQFPEFSQQQQLSPKFSGPDDNKVIKIGAVLGNVNIITQNHNNPEPNNPNQHLPNANGNGAQLNYTFGEPVQTNKVLSGTNSNQQNMPSSQSRQRMQENDLNPTYNAYLEQDAGRYATGQRIKNKSKLKMQTVRKRASNISNLEDEHSPYAQRESSHAHNNIKMKQHNKDRSQRQLKQYRRQANDSRTGQYEDADQANGEKLVIGDVLNNLEKGFKKIDDQEYVQVNSMESEEETTRRDERRSSVDDQTKYQDKFDPDGDYGSHIAPSSVQQKHLKHDLLSKTQPESFNQFTKQTRNEDPQLDVRNKMSNVYQKQTQQIMNIRRAYDSTGTRNSQMTKKSEPSVSLMQNALMRQSNGQKIISNQHRGFASSFSNQGNYNMLTTQTGNTRTQTRGQTDKEGHTNSGTLATALPSISKPLSRENQTQEYEPGNFLPERGGVFAQNKTKYGKRLINNEDKRYDFRKKKNLTNISRIEALAKDIKSKQVWNKGNLSVDLEAPPQITEQKAEQRQTSLLESFDQRLQPNYQALLDSPRRRPKTKQVGGYEQNMKYRAYKLVPVNFQPRAQKYQQKNVLSSSFLDVRNKAQQEFIKIESMRQSKPNILQYSIGDQRQIQGLNQSDQNNDILLSGDQEVQPEQILNISHPMSPTASLKLRQEVAHLQSRTRKSYKNANSMMRYTQEPMIQRDKTKSITKAGRQNQTDRKWKSKQRKVLSQSNNDQVMQHGGDVDYPTQINNTSVNIQDALEAQENIMTTEYQQQPEEDWNRGRNHRLPQVAKGGLGSQGESGGENFEILNKSIEQSSYQDGDTSQLYQKIKHKTQTNWNAGSQNLMHHSQQYQEGIPESMEEGIICQTQPGSAANNVDMDSSQVVAVESVEFAAQVNMGNQFGGFDREPNQKGAKQSRRSVPKQHLQDQNTAYQTEKLKKIVNSKQQISHNLRENLKKVNDPKNPATGAIDPNRTGKTPIGPIQEIKATYFSNRPKNQQRRRMDPVSLLNQREMKIMSDIKQKSMTNLNLANVQKRPQISQVSSTKKSLSPGARRVTAEYAPPNKTQERHHSVLIGKNHIELNKQLRDPSNVSQMSRISRLTDRQNALGPRIAARAVSRSESQRGVGGVSSTQLANKESIQSGQNAASQHKYVSVQDEQIEDQNTPYDNVINIKLPSARQKQKEIDQARKAARHSRDGPSRSPAVDTKQKPLTKATEKASLQKKDAAQTKTPITRPLDLAKITKARDEAEKNVRLAKQRKDAKAGDDPRSKRGKATSSIKAINKRLYYDRKYGAEGNAALLHGVPDADEEVKRFTDVRLEHGRLSLSPGGRGNQELKGNKLKSPTGLGSPRRRGGTREDYYQHGAKGKHVKFHDQSDRGPDIAAEYRKKGGRATKFIQHNSPIDRYYKLYVTDAPARVFDGSASGSRSAQSPAKFRHLKGCAHYTSRTSLSPSSIRKGDEDTPSPARQKAALDSISKAGSLEEVVRMADQDPETRSVLQARQGACDCHQRQADMLRQRLTRQPSRTRSIAGGSVQAGDGMSMYGDFADTGPLEAQQYFRTFRAPCRRTCSTTHNPMFHCSRFGIQMKPMMRPQSAEKSKEQKQAELVRIDFAQTAINFAVHDGDRKQAQSTVNGRGSPDLQLRRQNSSASVLDRTSPLGVRATAEERELDRQDMKNIVKQIHKVEESYSRYGILTEKEVHHYYSVMRSDALENELSAADKKTLNKKCWKTLEHLMKSLILTDDYQIIFDSYTHKRAANELRFQNEKTPPAEIEQLELEQLIKILLRCQKMYDAKQEIVRILVKIRKRESLMRQFEEEVEDCTDLRAKGYYYIVLKLSTRIYNQIERLRVDNPMLNRPFIYHRKNMTNALVSDQLNIRENLIKQFRELKPELGRVLDKSGKIVKLQHIIALNQRTSVKVVKPENEALDPAAPQDRRETLIKRHRDRLQRAEDLALMGEEEDQPSLAQSHSQTEKLRATFD